MKNGFSLIEVIIALVLLLVTLTIFGVAIQALPLTKTARNQNIAYHIAAEKMEGLRNTQFSVLPPSGPFTDPNLLALPNATASLNIQNYQGSALIKEVTVVVNWLEEDKPRNVRLDTLMTSGGLNQP